jgi:hypothetical protein
MHYVAQFLSCKCGLAHPKEPTMQHLASKLALAARGAKAFSMSWEEKLAYKKRFQGILKSYTAAHPRTAVFPATPAEMRDIAPSIYQLAYKEGPAVASKLQPADVMRILSKWPMRDSRGGARNLAVILNSLRTASFMRLM